ncbi:MAG: PEP-CTERM sorting domain-containing protein [Singulisphaera sp.]
MTTLLTALRPSITVAARKFQVASICLVGTAVWLNSINFSLAVQYNFMSVSGTNVPGNGTTVSTFTSGLGNGTITVDHNSTTPNSLGNWGAQDNINAAIFPSQFATLFPGSGNVQGHLAQSMYGDPNPPPGFPAPVPNVTTVTFHLNYTGYLPKLAFGFWNTTTEVGAPVYNIKLMDSSNAIIAPSMVNILGTDDNTGFGQVLGLHQVLFSPSSGDVSFSNAILNAGGIHTNALFFDGIPVGTKEIIVTATLPPLNGLGDGVGYYFAEPVPEPSTIALATIGVGVLITKLFRRRRSS